jgi:hypothetical protein
MKAVSLRLSGVILLMLGAAIGTLVDRVPTRLPLRVGEYWLLSGDFHVHAFPGDGVLSPWTLRGEAERAGLDVIAVTNHNQVLTGRLARWVAERSPGPIMITGQEITNHTYHMIGVGLQRTVNATPPVAVTAADVRAQGGVAIAAHPIARFHGYDGNEAAAAIDGAEVAHPLVLADDGFATELRAFYERTRRMKPHLAAIGSSDFHGIPPPLGQCRTYLFVHERTEAGVLEAIRSGRTLAVDGYGKVEGDATLISLLGEARPAGRSDTHAGWRRLSVAFEWIGLSLMVLFGGRTSEKSL